MPVYEYECRACHSRFEKLEAISQDPQKTCPACGGETHRVVTRTAGFRINGSSTKMVEGHLGHCGDHAPCCGRETRCDDKPCE